MKKISLILFVFLFLAACSVSNSNKEVKQIEINKYSSTSDNYNSIVLYSKEEEITQLINLLDKAKSKKGILDMARSADYKVILSDSENNIEALDLWLDENIIIFTSNKNDEYNYRIEDKNDIKNIEKFLKVNK